MGLQLDDKQAPSTFYIGVYILITVGAVMMFVGFLGCYGAIQESQCLLGTFFACLVILFACEVAAGIWGFINKDQFFACLVILFACEVAAGIWGFINKDQVTQEMKDFYDNAYTSATLPSSIGAAISGKDEKREKAEGVLKVFHNTLQCCGTNKVTQGLMLARGVCPKMESLMEQFTQISCHGRIDELFTTKLYLIGIAALVVAVIMPNTSVSSYALPSEIHLGHGGSDYGQITKSQRVQDQVRMRMTQNRPSGSATVHRANDNASESSEYRMSSGMKYATVNPAFSSKSQMYSMDRKVAGPPVSQYGTARAGGWSSHSAVEISPNRKMSLGRRGGGGGGGGEGGSSIYSRGRDDMGYGYQTSHSIMRSVSRAQRDSDTMSLRSMQVNSLPPQTQPWVDDGEGSMISGGDSYGRSQVQMVSSNAGGSTMGTMGRALNGTLTSRNGDWQVEEQLYQNSVKPRGPAMRTLSRLNQNANRQNRMSMGSVVSGSSTIQQQKMGGGNSNGSYGSLPITRAMSTVSLKSMTKGKDTFDGQEYISAGEKMNDGGSAELKLCQLPVLSLLSCVFLGSVSVELCADLFVFTGILWNLSSKDNLKDKLASETLPELTEHVLVPLSQSGNQQSASESEIFYNTTGCLRNLSSVNEKVRQQMRECRGLVDSLVGYVQRSVETGKAEDKVRPGQVEGFVSSFNEKL
ncbi:UNVERIFIED_CONTAM: hypothetical protein FKN15_077553 [Acipenser sinensis]